MHPSSAGRALFTVNIPCRLFISGLIRQNRQELSRLSEGSRIVYKTSVPERALCSPSADFMPKEVDYTEVRNARAAKRQKLKAYGPPATVKLLVLGTGARGAPATLYVSTTNGSYIFNCGEGTQRLTAERRVRLVNLEHVFITRNCWSTVGGVPGALLTLSDMGLPTLTLHGPPGLGALYKDTRNFIQLRGMVVKHRHDTTQDFDGGGLSVRSVALYGGAVTRRIAETEESQTAPPSVDYFAYERTGGQVPASASPQPNAPQSSRESSPVPPLPDHACSYAYVCSLGSRPGKLLLEKCVQLGVPPGPLLGQLKNGKDVTLATGTVVKSSDVTSPDEKGAQFIVLDLPTVDFLPSLTELDSSVDRVHLAAVVHFSPPSVLATVAYQQWMSRLPRHVRHIVLNENGVGYGSEAVHRQQFILNRLDADVFPLLRGDQVEIEGPDSHPNKRLRMCPDSGKVASSEREYPAEVNARATDDVMQEYHKNITGKLQSNGGWGESKNGGSSITEEREIKSVGAKEEEMVAQHEQEDLSKPIYPLPGWEFNLRPFTGPDASWVVNSIQPDTFFSEVEANPAYSTRLAEYHQSVNSLHLVGNSKDGDSDGDIGPLGDSTGINGKYPQTIFLGTGSSIPNKKRNTSGILINLSAAHAMVLDCGEGTYGQLVRLLGAEEAARTLRTLGVIYISHLHADHHIGLIRILEARREAMGAEHRPCVLLAPSPIMGYLSMYHKNMAPILDTFRLVGNRRLLRDSAPLPSHVRSLLTAAGVEHVAACPVQHCPLAFGVRVQAAGRSVVYSGDTRPCDDLVELGKECDILIHEATHEDALHEEAVLRAHCTSSEAIDVGRRMGAQHIILTHFSQRYAAMPLLPDSTPGNVSVAYDNMVVDFCHLPRLPLMLPVLREIFAEYIDQCLERLAKRETRKQRAEEALEAR